MRDPDHKRTVRIENNHEFRALQHYADSVLQPKGYKLSAKHGSSSWIDPSDETVRFKLCNLNTGAFFGVRQEWANVLGISVARIGDQALSFSPSPVLFRGRRVTNSQIGRKHVSEIVNLLPRAGQAPSNMDRKAANDGDRLKHALLLEVLVRTQTWPRVVYSETHAGAGVYYQSRRQFPTIFWICTGWSSEHLARVTRARARLIFVGSRIGGTTRPIVVHTRVALLWPNDGFTVTRAHLRCD